MLIVLRYTCLAFDRPLALSKETPAPSKNTPVPMPEPIDDEYLWETSEGQQPQGLPSRLAFFVYAMKLLDIKAKSPFMNWLRNIWKAVGLFSDHEDAGILFMDGAIEIF